MPPKLIYLLLFLSLLAYLLTGLLLKREDFNMLISLYSGLFILYFLLLKFQDQLSLSAGIAAGLLFRLSLLFSFPVLSDDVYRFLWDGRLQQLGINPFDLTPKEIIGNTTDSYLQQLFPLLNSPEYHSVYPQLLQYIFRLATEIGGQSILAGIIVLKSVIFLFECGTIYLLSRLFKIRNINPRAIYIYLFNPLIIIELTGNIHFEALMIFFILLTAWLLTKKTFIVAAVPLSMAVQAKLIPLIGIPLLIPRFGLWKTMVFGFACALLLLINSPVFWGSPDRVLHLLGSLQLYYGKFEFNGSIYSVLRAAGWWLWGYNPIEWLSKIMILLTLITFWFIYRSKADFLQGFFWLICSYLLFSAVVHPWYLAILVALSPFVKYQFALAWTALIPLTYITYTQIPYEQNYWIIGLEYLLVMGLAAIEIRKSSESALSNTLTSA